MPTPKPGEQRKDYISRCIPIVISDGTAKDNEQAAAVCYSMWSQHHKDNSAEDATLKNVEIFKAGKWNNLAFDESALDDMVTAFEELSAVHRVPLKFGHRPDEQIPKGQPALGWVTNLRRVGKSLLADFTHVPKLVKAAFEKKLYRTVSIEMLMGARIGKKTFKHVLDAVALLGADQPAVHGLGDLDQFLAERSVAFDDAGHRLAFETIAGDRKTQVKETQVNEEDVKKIVTSALGEFAKEFKKNFSADDDTTRKELRELRDKAEAAERENVRLKAERAEFEQKTKSAAVTAKREQIKLVFENAVKARSMTPAQRDGLMADVYSDDAMVEKANIETLRTQYSVSAKFERGGAHNEGGRQADVSPDAEMVRLTKDYQVKNGVVDFSIAFERVAAANPELHLEYLNMYRQEAH